MSLFMDEMKSRGHDARVVEPEDFRFHPCKGCGACEENGYCVFKDEFTTEFLPLLLTADMVVLSSPVYFYSFPGPLKSMIDRSQVLWARKYRDVGMQSEFLPRSPERRRGILLSAGATKGADLFDGMMLTARYFFDAAGISFSGHLCYRQIDRAGEMKKHPTVKEDIRALVESVLT
jgi:multimeric flavodoxin WrbA